MLMSSMHSNDGYVIIVVIYMSFTNKIVKKISIASGLTGVSRGQSTVSNSQRCNTAKAYLQPAASRDNLHVATNAHVTKVNKWSCSSCHKSLSLAIKGVYLLDLVR